MQRQICSTFAINTSVCSSERPGFNAALMGQFKVELGGVPLNLNSHVAQSVFAYLALNAGKALRREKLAGLFWPELMDTKARCQLRHTLWRIRKAINACGYDGFAFIPEDALHIQFHTGPGFQLDVATVLQPITAHHSSNDVIAQLAPYDELLPGFNGSHDEWTSEWQYRLDQVYAYKGLLLIDRLIREGRCLDALEWGGRLMVASPHMEPVRQKMAVAFQGLADQWQLHWPTARVAP